MIYFKEDGHEYLSKDPISWVSVTTLIKKYSSPYNSEFWSSYKAIEKLIGKKGIGKKIHQFMKKGKPFSENMSFIRYCLNSIDDVNTFQKEKKKILKQWSDNGSRKATKGTLYHQTMEKKDIETGEFTNPDTNNILPVNFKEHHDGYDNSSYESLENLKPGLYPELLIFNKEFGILGQADRVIIEDNGDVYVRDYKTSDKIPFNSYKGEKKLMYPIDNLEDCKGVKYQLQLSIYAYMLELSGYNIKKLYIDHFNTEIEVDYLRDEVKKLFNNYKLTQQL